MPRLRTVSPNGRGWTRRRAGSGFVYLDQTGTRLCAEDSARCRELVIPPAWHDVCICPWPNGHIQAVGVDPAGRRQYLYHPEWRAMRDRMKFDRVTEVAASLPAARAAIVEHIALDANGSSGLTTLEKRHVRRERGRLLFCFVGKSGKEHCIEIDDPLPISAVEMMMRRRRSGGDRLLAYKRTRQWLPVDAGTVNAYLRETTGAEISANLRTWHATVAAAASLATTAEQGEARAPRKRAVRQAMAEVSE